ncbi:lipopolysaccharide kinase InaA family protein [Methylobacillus arboreus]|uniref:lipopolysaccharide kinase InaA family protein n=1 Tax=Methylobacillus arboreus TaxID=755170 RepID=UPI001E4A2661|nr:lipopolysaccharide kinase InaA family protein [Methylobacillus arboreus]MCB5189782.1 lipopolysaccharide kinase InaA family protein [Methylobacillus arboreus]
MQKPHNTPSGVRNFDKLWNYQGEWFEKPNQHRQGWSGVSRILIHHSNKAQRFYAFLKRQQNFMRRTWRHPFSGVSTFSCEYATLLYLRSHGVPVPSPLFFSEQKQNGNVNAVLLTAALEGYQPLNDVVTQLLSGSWSIHRQRKLIASVAKTVAHLHSTKIQHRALYPKHVFVRENVQGEFDSVLIDLEKARLKLFSCQCALHDLATLNRDLMQLSLSNRLYFLKQYYGVKKLSFGMKLMVRLIQARTLRKQKR